MKKTIAAVLTALAMVVALVLPMTAFADDKAPTPKKTYEEEYSATRNEPDYDVVVDEFDEEDVVVDEEDADTEAAVVVDADTDDVDLTLDAPSLIAVKGLDIDLPDGNYDIDYDLSGTGIMKLVEPATLTVKDGKAYARLAWNFPEVDKLYLNGETLLPVDYTKSHNITGKLPVFLLPLSRFCKDIDFDVHTRGVNLELDQYKLNMKEYDPNFDATELKAKVAESIRGAQPSEFYKWHTGMKSSIWGPFAFLAAEALALFGWNKYWRKKDE
ncbi:MAG: hypothetical protein IIY48_01430 [Clostridia bacterium]|nr:hypothetical protein [Clostridia bacterium]MBQ1529916.1 hypothetical protein [Clostridia bacterium]